MWFQRALSSGMKESIDRKVVLHDQNLGLFARHFIEYLYSGHLNEYRYEEKNEASSSKSAQKRPIKLTNDELIELLIFADKYEVNKNLREFKKRSRIL